MTSELTTARLQHNDDSKHIIINVVDVMDEIKQNVHIKSRTKLKYAFKYIRFCIALLITISYLVLHFINTPRYARRIYFAIILLFGLFTIIYGIITTRKSKSSFKLWSNHLLGIPAITDDIFDFAFKPYAGSILLLVITYYAFVSMIFPLFITLFPAVWVLGINLSFLVLIKRANHTTTREINYIAECKDNLLIKYASLKYIQDRIDIRLSNWKKKQYLFTVNKMGIMEWIVISAVLLYISFPTWASSSTSTTHFTVIIFVYMIHAVMGAFLFRVVHSLYLYYQLGYIIMEELGIPLNSTTMDDIVGWWKFRKFYKEHVVKMYLSSLSIFIAASLTSCMVLIIFSVSNFINYGVEHWAYLVVPISAVLTTILMFLFILNASKYHETQLKHVHMITNESLVLRMDQKNDFSYYIWMNGVFEQMEKDILRNSDALRVFGLKINSKFMVVLRTTIGTLIVAVLTTLSKTILLS